MPAVGLAIAMIVTIVGGFLYVLRSRQKQMPAVDRFLDAFYDLYNQQQLSRLYQTLSDQQIRKLNPFPAFESVMKEKLMGIGQADKAQRQGARLDREPRAARSPHDCHLCDPACRRSVDRQLLPQEERRRLAAVRVFRAPGEWVEKMGLDSKGTGLSELACAMPIRKTDWRQ